MYRMFSLSKSRAACLKSNFSTNKQPQQDYFKKIVTGILVMPIFGAIYQTVADNRRINNHKQSQKTDQQEREAHMKQWILEHDKKLNAIIAEDEAWNADYEKRRSVN